VTVSFSRRILLNGVSPTCSLHPSCIITLQHRNSLSNFFILLLTLYLLTVSMEMIPLELSWSKNYPPYKEPEDALPSSLNPVLSRMNPVCTKEMHFLSIPFNYIPNHVLIPEVLHFHASSPVKMLQTYKFLVSPIRATYSAISSSWI